MSDKFSAFEQRLLWLLQSDFPLAERPYAVLAERLQRSEQDVMDAVAGLRHSGVVRQIGAIFDTERLGYTSALVAMRVRADRLEEVAARVSAHRGVSHNYSRDHDFNLWFTLAAPPGENLVQAVRALAAQAGVLRYLILPTVRVFKIDARFGADERTGGRSTMAPHVSEAGVLLAQEDIPLVRVLQEDLPVESRPFRALSEPRGMSEEAVLDGARRLLEAGIMRRYGATLRHRVAGYVANAMVCWDVDPSQVEPAGKAAAEHPAVSHCYQRPAQPPEWPYSLFTMVHARSDGELEAVVADLRERIRPRRFATLRTVREFKKARLRYFDEG